MKVAGGLPVIYDGGVRRGTDVMKAYALGAAFVFVGRPMLCAAVVRGPPGVERACRTLRYHGPILRAPAWAAIYVQDAERIQDWEQAVASDAAVTAAWQRYGYEVTELPLAGVDERLDFVRSLLQP